MPEIKPPEPPKTDQPQKNEPDLSGKNPFLSPVFFLIILSIPIFSWIMVSLNAPVETTPPPPEQLVVKAEEIATAKQRAEPKIKGSANRCAFNDLIGRPADDAAIQSIKNKNRPYRVLPPGSMMTMDMNPDRVNLDTDEGGIIRRIWCG